MGSKGPDRQRRQFLNYSSTGDRDFVVAFGSKAPIDAILAQLANMD
jgi:hypothetical protein